FNFGTSAFLVYVNDLPCNIEDNNTTCFLYAEDICSSMKSQNANIDDVFASKFDALAKWCDKTNDWRVTLLTISHIDIHDSIKKFWTVAELPNTITPEDREFEAYFKLCVVFLWHNNLLLLFTPGLHNYVVKPSGKGSH
ncbi:hypothetical protein J6590_094018, partial [Homalodisca vitripennis]